MNTKRTEDLATKIEQLVREHLAGHRRAVAEAVERAFASDAQTAPGRRSSSKRSASVSRPSAAPTRGLGRRRTAAEMAALEERFYRAVCERPGETMLVLAQEVGVDPRELHRPMTRLREAGRVRSAGERNRTRYFPMDGDASTAA